MSELTTTFTCGCHHNHSSKEEHDQFWGKYGRRHGDDVARQTKAMPFGKYKGQPIEQVPKWYLSWLVKNVKIKPWLADSIRAVLSGQKIRRGKMAKSAMRENKHESVEVVGRDYVPSTDTTCPFDV